MERKEFSSCDNKVWSNCFSTVCFRNPVSHKASVDHITPPDHWKREDFLIVALLYTLKTNVWCGQTSFLVQFIFNSCSAKSVKVFVPLLPHWITWGAVQLTSTCKLQPFDFHAFETMPEESENPFFLLPTTKPEAWNSLLHTVLKSVILKFCWLFSSR